MTHITHTEIVSLIDSDDYYSILKYFDKFPSNAEKHIDYYFDDKEGILSRNNIILRKRQKSNDKFQTGIKIPNNKKPGEVFDLKDQTHDSFFKSFPEEIQKTIKRLGIKEIYYVGNLPTKRISIPCLAVEGKWIIDHVTFPLGNDDYRIELKHAKHLCGKASDIFNDVLQKNHLILVTPQPKLKKLFECMLEDEKIKKNLREGARKALQF